MGNNLLELMQKQGLSQISLSEKSGVSQSYISKLCLNKSRRPSLEKAKNLADALGVSVEQLFGDAANTYEDITASFEPTQMEYEYLRKLRFLSDKDKSTIYSAIDMYYELAKRGGRFSDFPEETKGVSAS